MYLPSLFVDVFQVCPAASFKITSASARMELSWQSRTTPARRLLFGAFFILYVSRQHPSPRSELKIALLSSVVFSGAKK